MPLEVDPKDNQQVFDYALRKIREQGKPAVDGSVNCMYRTDDGLRCVAGCLIPDEEYDSKMEGVQVASGGRIQRWFKKHGFDLELISAMQNAHDNNAEGPGFMKNFNEDMMRVALQFNLRYS